MSPKVLDYHGISLEFFSNEHTPIHVHATYGHDKGMMVLLFAVEDNIKPVYSRLSGYDEFPPAQMRDLKLMIKNRHKKILNDWYIAKVLGKKVKREFITKKLR